MTSTLYATIVLEPLTCCRKGCGVTFGMDADVIKHRRRDHESFWCPNGHSQYFPGKSDIEKERDRADQLSDELARANTRALRARQEAEHERRRVAAAKGRLTKLKNRIAKGVCPSCNRYFEPLHRHLAQEHPEYVLPEGVTLEPTDA